MDKEGIVIDGLLSKITTTVDGGWKITFDLGSDMTEIVSQLSKMRDEYLRIVILKVD